MTLKKPWMLSITASSSKINFIKDISFVQMHGRQKAASVRLLRMLAAFLVFILITISPTTPIGERVKNTP